MVMFDFVKKGCHVLFLSSPSAINLRKINKWWRNYDTLNALIKTNKKSKQYKTGDPVVYISSDKFI